MMDTLPATAVFMLLLVLADVALWFKNKAMPRRVIWIFVISRLYWFIFYTLIALKLITDPVVNIVLGRTAVLIFLVSEIVVMLAYLLGDRRAKSK